MSKPSPIFDVGSRPVYIKSRLISGRHFGAYLMGSGSGFLFDGEALSRCGAVVVTLNFRLGRLGFLAHPELSGESSAGASGNYGLMDQIAALKWVQDNIAAFGGDPDCVTIMGQSSGSGSVSILMASALARGLFHRAIGQSGGAFEPPRSDPGWPGLCGLADAEADGVALCASLGVSGIAELREQPAGAILAAFTQNGAINWRQGLRNPAFLCAYPIADGHVIPATGLIPHYAAGRQAHVPLLTGFTAKEGGGKFGPSSLDAYWAEADADFGGMAGDYRRVYPAHDDETARQAASVAIGDKLFSWQNWAWASLHASSSVEPVFFYHFARVPPYPPGLKVAETDGDPAKELGAIHGGEIPYVFRNFHVRSWPWTETDRELSSVMSRHWITFARTGDPNVPGQPRWPRFTSTTPNAMIFGDTIQSGLVPAQERLSFWDRHYNLHTARHS